MTRRVISIKTGECSSLILWDSSLSSWDKLAMVTLWWPMMVTIMMVWIIVAVIFSPIIVTGLLLLGGHKLYNRLKGDVND